MLTKSDSLSLSTSSGRICFFFTKTKDIADCPFFLACPSHCNRLPTVQCLRIFHYIVRAISRKFKQIPVHFVQTYICVLPIRKFFKKLV